MKKLGKDAKILVTSKKGQAVNELTTLITTLAFIAILLAVVFMIMAQVKSNVETTGACFNTSNWYNTTAEKCTHNSTSASNGNGLSHALNATNQTTVAMADIPGWLPIIVIAIIGGILIGLVQFFRRGQ